MTNYVDAIKRGFIDVYGFPENPEKPGCVLGEVPDGVYPLVIDGKTDFVVVKDNKINCGNDAPPEGAVLAKPKGA